MKDRMTLGQYYPADSVLHKMDPRVKLTGTIVYIIALFLAKSIWGYLLAAAFLVSVIIISKVPVKFMVKGMRSIVLLIVITVLFNMFMTPGETLVEFGRVHITKEGAALASAMAIRLIFLIMGSNIMTLTTTPNQLTDGLESLMSPLKIIHMPVHEVAMMMSIALRFIPILMEETDKIMKAQMARGASFDEGNLIERAKSLVPLLVPLFVSAFRRAGDLALAMEARCYRGGEHRTKMKPLCYKAGDYIGYVVLAALFAAAIAIRIIL